MEFCKNYPLVAWTHVDRKTALFTRLRCGQWSCEYCAAKNASIWRAFLLNKLPELADNWWLVTLTAHSQLRTRGQSLENIRSNIDRLMKRLHRTFGRFDYVRTYEKHPSSEAIHAHLIVSNLSPFVVHGYYKNGVRGFIGVLERPYRLGCWSLASFVKFVTQEVQMGYVADARRIENTTSHAIWYVTKYLTKEQQDLNVKGLRHVQTSRGVGSPKMDSRYTWQVGSFVTARDFQSGQSLTDLQTGMEVDGDYWNEFDVYPPEMM